MNTAPNIQERDQHCQKTNCDADGEVIPKQKNDETDAEKEEGNVNESGETLDDEVQMPSLEAAKLATVQLRILPT
jgi:hypothetical protein